MAVMETLHNTVPEESRIYVVFVLVILWDVRLNVGAKLIDGDASVMTVCIVYGVLWQVSKMVSAFVEVGIEHNKNRGEKVLFVLKDEKYLYHTTHFIYAFYLCTGCYFVLFYSADRRGRPVCKILSGAGQYER